jgi:hypothetical protein
VKRVIVLGGQGLFGRTVVEQLKLFGISALVAGRHQTADIQLDANDAASLRTGFATSDLVVDTAGPFQRRSLALVQTATEVGFDVVDINDNLHYAEQVVALGKQIATAGIRVLSSASSVSALAAAAVLQSGVSYPVRVTAFLAPASRHTANPGSAISLIESVGSPVRTFREGKLQTLRGWTEPHRFPMPGPLGPICGRLFESADAIYLPRIWPSLREVQMYVDTNTAGVNTLLLVAIRFPRFRRWIERRILLATQISKLIGSKIGGIGYEIEGPAGEIVRMAALSAENSFVIAVAPAVLAAQAIFTNRFNSTGLVLPHLQVEAAQLWEFLKAQGIDIVRIA